MIKLKIARVKMTKEEKLSLLIEEAKKRGFIPGAKFSDAKTGKWHQMLNSPSYRKEDDSKIYCALTNKDDVVTIAVQTESRGSYIYYEGKWAELANFKFSWEAPDKKPWNPNKL